MARDESSAYAIFAMDFMNGSSMARLSKKGSGKSFVPGFNSSLLPLLALLPALSDF